MAKFNAMDDFEEILGTSQVMRSIYSQLNRVSESDTTILITGENGTGKEVLAKSIHSHSRRKDQNYVAQSCGAFNDNLLESELFGHVKGAFTNAHKDKKGLFELADKGTLFLDEIGDTSPVMQVKLLRILQEGKYIPVGGTEEKTVDVRILAATNRNLEKMVETGHFREDLYYRINVININLPPLRERKEDLNLLVENFLHEFSKLNHLPEKKISPECQLLMERYPWPGNVRELKNEIERLCVLSGSEILIGPDMLSSRILKWEQENPLSLVHSVDTKINFEQNLKEAIEDLERKMIFMAMNICNWNKSKASLKLGISRASLIMKCEKYGFFNPNMFKKIS